MLYVFVLIVESNIWARYHMFWVNVTRCCCAFVVGFGDSLSATTAAKAKKNEPL